MREANPGVTRVAAVGDIHVAKSGPGELTPLLHQASERADVLLLCGDLTDYGLVEEARVLARELSASAKIPVIAVLGNHDFEADKQDEIRCILTDAGVSVLDGDVVEVHGIGFAGVRGFCGGFGRGALGPWGEGIIKQFVHEAVNESLKLESALARLRVPTKIALLHYAPVRDTVQGEPYEIFPFLGSSRLEEPLTRYDVRAVFHGHAHNGQIEGKTSTGAPVYNVAMPLLQKMRPDDPPFLVIDVAHAVQSVAKEPGAQGAVAH